MTAKPKKKVISGRKAVRKRPAAAPGGPFAAFCRTLPGTTEDVKWGDDLIFSVGKKMYAGFGLEDTGECAIKCSEEDFWRLIQKDGIIPAPYAARFFWVAVKKRNALPAAEMRRLLTKAHAIVLAGLPKRKRDAILAAARPTD